MSIYIPFNFRPVETKIVGTTQILQADSNYESYSPTAGRYAHITGSGGLISFTTNFKSNSIGLRRKTIGPFLAANATAGTRSLGTSDGLVSAVLNQPNGQPFNNVNINNGNSDVFTSTSGGVVTIGWTDSNGHTPAVLNYNNPHLTALNIIIEWYFVPHQNYNFWLNQNQTIYIFGMKAVITEYVNI